MKELTLHDLMPKGRYKGMRISEIAKSNPKYLQWMIDMEYIKVTDEVDYAASSVPVDLIKSDGMDWDNMDEDFAGLHNDLW